MKITRHHANSQPHGFHDVPYESSLAFISPHLNPSPPSCNSRMQRAQYTKYCETMLVRSKKHMILLVLLRIEAGNTKCTKYCKTIGSDKKKMRIIRAEGFYRGFH